MNIELSPAEVKTIKRYRKHLWNTAKINEQFRDVLYRILSECDEELDMIERDLKAERNKC